MKKLLFLVCIILSGIGLYGQPGTGNMHILGRVSNAANGQGVAGHRVFARLISPSLNVPPQQMFTNANGQYSFVFEGGSVTGPNRIYEVSTYDRCDSTLLYTDTVQNRQGTVNVAEVFFNICTSSSCNAGFTYMPVTGHPLRIRFQSNNVTTEALHYRWTWGGQVISEQPSFEYTFPAAGQYDICLTVRRGNNPVQCEEQRCSLVVVPNSDPFCNARFDFLYASDRTYVHPVAPYSNNYSYVWVNVTSGHTYTGPNPEINFVRGAMNQVCLTVSDNGNCTRTYCDSIYIPNRDTCRALFSHTPSPTNPRRFIFHNTSEGGTTSGTVYTWNFGDGSPQAHSFHAEHTFEQPGTYSVCLRIETANCTNEICRTIVVPGPTCTAAFNWNSAGSALIAPVTVQFNSAGNNVPGEHEWAFGNGQIANVPNPIHIYTTPGSYTVCHTFWNNAANCRDSACQDILIRGDTINCQLDAGFTYAPVTGAPLRVRFQANSSGIGGLNYRWTRGGQLLSESPEFEYTFPEYGQYEVCLRVRHGSNPVICEEYLCTNVIIPNPDPFCNARFDFLLTTAGMRVQPVAPYSNNYSYVWINQTSNHTYTGPNPDIDFIPGAVNLICLSVSDNANCSASFCDSIFIPRTDTCRASFTLMASNIRRFAFHNTSDGGTVSGTTYTWDFGDGSPQEHSFHAEHTFNQPGNYNVCLTITTGSCTDQTCMNVEVVGVSCSAAFNWSGAGSALIAPATVQFNSNPNITAGGHSWNFGDGHQADGPSPVHTYAAPGTYTVCHIAWNNSENCRDSVCRQIVIRGDTTNNCNLNASFSAQPVPNTTLAGHLYVFKALHDVPANSGVVYTWRFGNSSSEVRTGREVQYRFPAPGEYTVCLKITGPNGCVAEQCRQIIVPPHDSSCRVSFTFTPSTANPLRVLFRSQNSTTINPNTQYHWDFGDSTTSSQPNPEHTFPAPGNYYVCLTVTRAGCTNTYCALVTVHPLEGNFSIGGQIFAGAHTADHARVLLIKRDPVSGALFRFAQTFVDSAGRYIFNNVPEGRYLIRAELIPPSAWLRNYIPTYFGSQFYWQLAQPVDVSADVFTYHISLIYANNFGGPGFVRGRIRFRSNREAEGSLSEVTMVLTDVNNAPQRWVFTDADGNFSMDDLAFGTYRLWTDLPGIPSTPVEFTLSEEAPDIDFTLLIDDVIQAIQNTEQSSLLGELFPNPAATSAQLNISLVRSTKLSVELHSLTGQSVWNNRQTYAAGKQTLLLPVGELEKGLYLLTIHDENNTLIGVRKLIIAR